jgi:hypothetical protein
MIRRVTAVLAVITAVFLVVVPPASAGGPTSVLIASPGKSRAAALYTTQSDYQDLDSYIGQYPRESDKDAPESLRGGPGTSAINVTWLIHDVHIWRVDRVYFDIPGGPWVESHMSTTGASPDLGQRGVVHRASSPKQLSALVDRLLADQATTLPGVVPAAAPVAPQAPEPSWHWASALLGLAGGVVVMVGIQLAFGLLPRRRTVASR